MNDLSCEDVFMAKMAELDGETPELDASSISLHLKECPDCGREIKEMTRLDSVFARQARTQLVSDIWPAVEQSITPRSTRQISWIPFAVVAVLLIVYKFAEILPERSFGLGFTVVPLVLLVVLFLALRENPFRINSELTPQR